MQEDLNDKSKNARGNEKMIGGEYLIRPLRTYEDDVANFVKDKKVSTSKIMLAEQERRERQENLAPQKSQITEQIKEPSNLLKIILAGVFIILGIGAIVGAFIYLDLDSKLGDVVNNISSNENKPENDSVNQNLSNDVEVIIDTNNRFTRDIREEITNAIKNASGLENKQIVEIQITRDGSFGEGSIGSKNAQITTEQFFAIYESLAPGSLIRGLGSSYFLGLIQLDKVHPFILFKINDFDQVFGAMFEWENAMVRELDEIFYENLIPKEVVISGEKTDINDTLSGDATATSATSSPIITKIVPEYNPRNFVDLVFNNRDVRAIQDVDGNLLFFYSFIDEKNLILADSPDVMNELIQRLNLEKLVR